MPATQGPVLITGATGMVGASLVRRLLDEQCEVVVLSRPGANRTRLSALLQKIRLIDGDLRSAESVTQALAQTRPTVVFHLATTPFNPPPLPAEHLAVNTIGMANLIEALNHAPDARIVYTSSAAVYGSASRTPESTALAPATILGATKAAAGMLLQAHARMRNRPAVELRLFTPYGPWEKPTRLIPSVVLSALAGRTVEVSAGLQRRDFVYIADVVDAILAAAALPSRGFEVFNIGSGEGTEVRRLVSLVLELMGDPVRANFGALPTRSDEIIDMSADAARAGATLGWRPRVELEDGVKRTIEWIVANAALIPQLS